LARSERSALLAGAALLLAAGCTEIDNALARVPAFAFMRESPAQGPYQNPRPAPPGAVPYDAPLGVVLPPMEATAAELAAFEAGPHASNPLAREDTAVLEIGRAMYERHCAVCHGVTGLGDGPVIGAGRFPFASDLVQGPALGQSDAYIYGVIRAGRGLMPAYGARISHLERWAIVNYVRALQAAAGSPAPPAVAPPTGAEPAPVPDGTD
jgi:mono/diheme cytochrome c family protein